MKYWEYQKWNIATAQPKIPEKSKMVNIYFTSVAVLGGKLHISHPTNMNYVNKKSNSLLYDIVTLGTNVHGGDTILNDVICVYDLGQRTHVLKHLHGRCIVGPFERVFHEISLWRRNRAIVSFIFHKSIFVHFHHKGDVFYNRYINTEEGERIWWNLYKTNKGLNK